MPLNVLIVEDEFLIAMDMDAKLCELGHTPVGYSDSVSNTMRRITSDVDLAFVDIGLTDGATGFTIGKSLAQEYGIKVIFLTSDPSRLENGVQGTIGVVKKPVNTADLASILDYVEKLGTHSAIASPPNLRLFG